MKRAILTYPESSQMLSKISEEVNWDECQDLIQDLRDTLNEYPDGAGISAIQIGIPKRVCLIRYDGREIVMINPKITWTRRGTQLFREGCLSVPNKYVEVERPQKVVCSYINELGQEEELAEGGWMSAIVQHELDHLDGICQVNELESVK